MRQDVQELCDRTLDFAVAIVNLTGKLPRNLAGNHIGGQLLRAGTSGPANYEEACAAESRADFVHKLQISLKEFRECCFWLKVIVRSDLAAGLDGEKLLQEAQELRGIFTQSVITAKSNRGKNNG